MQRCSVLWPKKLPSEISHADLHAAKLNLQGRTSLEVQVNYWAHIGFYSLFLIHEKECLSFF